jgi:hypothetical protein
MPTISGSKRSAAGRLEHTTSVRSLLTGETAQIEQFLSNMLLAGRFGRAFIERLRGLIAYLGLWHRGY